MVHPQDFLLVSGMKLVVETKMWANEEYARGAGQCSCRLPNAPPPATATYQSFLVVLASLPALLKAAGTDS